MTTKTTNTRAPAQWAAISAVLNFRGRTVIDLGFGFGDLLIFAMDAGAAHVHGVDQDPIPFGYAADNFYRFPPDRWSVDLTLPIQDFCRRPGPVVYDIGICFSVLPYLNSADRLEVVGWLFRHTVYSFVEMQYAGDGPGPEGIRNDSEMAELLETFWPKAEKIGETEVAGRRRPDGSQVFRSIWFCKKMRIRK